MSLGSDLQTDINAILFDDDDFGRDVTLRKKVSSAYDPTTGAATKTATNYATRGLLLAYKDRAIDGTLVKAGDRKCVMKVPTSVAPAVGDELLVGSDSYNVVSFKTVELAGTVILYTLQIRK